MMVEDGDRVTEGQTHGGAPFDRRERVARLADELAGTAAGDRHELVNSSPFPFPRTGCG